MTLSVAYRPLVYLKGPAEKIRLYFLLAWFHAIVQERLRYVPLGWSKTYDFNDSDMSSAFTTIDTWLSSVSKGRTNIDPITILGMLCVHWSNSLCMAVELTVTLIREFWIHSLTIVHPGCIQRQL